MTRFITLMLLLTASMSFGQGTTAILGGKLDSFSLPRESGPVYRFQPAKPTVICVIAYWCDTWKEQLRRLAHAKQMLNGLPCDFLVVSVDGRWTGLGAECPWATKLNDPNGTWSKGIGIDKIPYTMVVDPSGTLQLAQTGIVRSEAVVRAVREPAERLSSEIYLTFDDFPARTGDDELLDILRREQVPATFFCIGTNLDARPTLGTRAVSEGHSLQMHGWNHDADQPDLSRLESLIRRLGGEKPALYRPPGSNVIQGLATRPAVIDPNDYRQPPGKELLRRIMGALKPGAVIQLHAGVAVTREILPALIEGLRERGYNFRILR